MLSLKCRKNTKNTSVAKTKKKERKKENKRKPMLLSKCEMYDR